MTLKVLADENIPGLEQYLEHGINLHRASGRDMQPALLRDVDVLLVRSVTRVDEALLKHSPVRFVGSATSGIDHVDRDYLKQREITFAHAPGSNANSVVEYVLSAIAAIDEKLEELLGGGTVGIVGFGNVGRALATRLEALEVSYRVYDPWLEQHSIPSAAGLEDVLNCHVVSLHPELTRASPWPSYHLLGKEALSRLRTDALLINASRGAVVDNAALLEQLESGSGPLVALDVWEGEPALKPGLLQRVELGTPHIAGYSLDAKLRATCMLDDALARFLDKTPMVTERNRNSPPPIQLQQPLSAADLIRSLLTSRYAIRDDDALLRRVVLTRGYGKGEGFDHLRKTYRERRELSGSRVSCEGESGNYGALAAALGCQLDSPGEPV